MKPLPFKADHVRAAYEQLERTRPDLLEELFADAARMLQEEIDREVVREMTKDMPTRWRRYQFGELSYPLIVEIFPKVREIPQEVLEWCVEHFGEGKQVQSRHPQQDPDVWEVNNGQGKASWLHSTCGLIYLQTENQFIEFKLRWF